jgi:hypothetical protein
MSLGLNTSIYNKLVMGRSKTYTIDTTCSNCDYDGKAILPRKMKVSEVLPKTECPQCGCNTLSKKSKVTSRPFLTNQPKYIPRTLPNRFPNIHFQHTIPTRERACKITTTSKAMALTN